MRTLPRAEEIKLAEFLSQLDRLIHNPLMLFIVAKLDIARRREVLTQRVTGNTDTTDGVSESSRTAHLTRTRWFWRMESR